MKIRFLLDENLSPRLKTAVLRLNPSIDIIRIGESGTPPLGTLDPEVLQYLEQSQRLLITDNRTSMPAHLEEHWQENRKIYGLFWVRPSISIGALATELLMIWETSEAEEWIDRLAWIPL